MLEQLCIANRLRFSIFLALSASHHLATLRLASLAAKNLESLPNLVLCKKLAQEWRAKVDSHNILRQLLKE